MSFFQSLTQPGISTAFRFFSLNIFIIILMLYWGVHSDIHKLFTFSFISPFPIPGFFKLKWYSIKMSLNYFSLPQHNKI
jgi:hypothetical protein